MVSSIGEKLPAFSSALPLKPGTTERSRAISLPRSLQSMIESSPFVSDSEGHRTNTMKRPLSTLDAANGDEAELEKRREQASALADRQRVMADVEGKLATR